LDVPADWKFGGGARRYADFGWVIAAVDKHPSGPGRPSWSETLDLAPAPPFLYGWAAGRFDEHTLDVDGVTLRALGPPGAHLAAVNALTAPMLRFLTAKTGARYPAATYTQVFVPGSAAQEAAGLSFLSADSITDVEKDPTEDWIFSHELAHQWFGWLVPCADFADFWLNEGFATFMVAAYKEEKWGRPAYERELALWRARSDKVHAAGRDAPLSLSGPNGPFPPAAKGAPPRRGPRDNELQPRGVTYSRGALLLDKLRCDLGDEVFWDGIRRYVKAGQGAAPGSGAVRSDDLRVALEAASGRDLKPLWAERVYSPFFDWSPGAACVTH
jgi:aminopeptidase N